MSARIATKLPSIKVKSPYPDGLNPLAIRIPDKKVMAPLIAFDDAEIMNLSFIEDKFKILYRIKLE